MHTLSFCEVMYKSHENTPGSSEFIYAARMGDRRGNEFNSLVGIELGVRTTHGQDGHAIHVVRYAEPWPSIVVPCIQKIADQPFCICYLLDPSFRSLLSMKIDLYRSRESE